MNNRLVCTGHDTCPDNELSRRGVTEVTAWHMRTLRTLKALVNSTGFKTYQDGFPLAGSENRLPVSWGFLPARHTHVTPLQISNGQF